MLLFAAIAFAYFFFMLLMNLFPEHPVKDTFMAFLRYACPPVEFLGKLALGKYSMIKSLGCVMHSLALTFVYSVVGIIILCRRQFVCVRD
jgi:hypothetical protein